MKHANSAILLTTLITPALSIAAPSSAKQPENQKATPWEEMHKEAVSVEGLRSGEVKNKLESIGNTKYLILDKTNKRIEYVVYELPRENASLPTKTESRYFKYRNKTGLSFNSPGIDVTIDESMLDSKNNQLSLTKKQAKDHLVSQLLNEEMAFSSGESLEIADMLINPESGKISHYVVELETDSLFDEQLRTVRVNNVSVSDAGMISANMSLDQIDKNQDYDPKLL